MSYDEIIQNTLQSFNLPRIEIEELFKNEVIIPCIELLDVYTSIHKELDHDNILIVMMLILNRMYERAIRRRTPKTIVFTSAIIWHNVINKNVEGKYIMQFPLKDTLDGNITANRFLRQELNIKNRRFEDINEFKEKLELRPPIWQVIKEVALKLEGSPTIKGIKNMIRILYIDIAEDDIERAVYCCTVNSIKRFRCKYNKEPRISNSKFDILYYLEEENFSLYKPSKNGIWGITRDSLGYLTCTQSLSPEEYKDLMEFISSKKGNAFVYAATVFLYFNIQKEFYSDNEIWRGVQIYLDRVEGETPEATLTTELIRHSTELNIISKRKDFFFKKREGKPNKFKILDSLREEINNYLSFKGISKEILFKKEFELN